MEAIRALNELPQNIADAIRGLFADPNSIWADLTMTLIGMILIIVVIVISALLLIVLERKIAGWGSQRPGPNRLGPRGWFQTIADALKLLGKEDLVPANADRFMFRIAPMFIFGIPILTLTIIPFGYAMTVIDLELGVFFYLGITSISTLALLMAGWSSNNKYSLLGGMRAVAQMISYEIPLIFSLLGVVMLTQTFNLTKIVEAQATLPFIFLQPLAFIIFLICGQAEVNRAPFDLLEADQEIIAGPFTEYTGLRWGLFYLGEYANLVAMCALATTVFLGGWQGPAVLPGWAWFWLKVGLLIFVSMWVRWTFPRIRIDHLMHLAWKVLLPLALLNILLTGLGIYIYQLVIGG
ncbi:NADH-quinone oxidoreductase subunit NuoH [Desulfitobacterium sp. PCE1]|uniref:NADH-quinone oxidoreductase subunit NuoH n=1 Tax=Desulfitobacterium sp. PCE1 TaxID=146907 RepID=UPI00035E514B|nr:NADH-quinone oxidoreductase subunit NuoH [Desulfitobacterium sp. PCE1]